MLLFWNIIYFTIPVFLFLLIPFMTFFYESDNGLLMAGTSVGATPQISARPHASVGFPRSGVFATSRRAAQRARCGE